MPTPAKGGRYHHGDLRAALIDTAIDIIGERGVRGFSLAEASRRLGVAVSAPYAHFTDRDALLAAVSVRAYELFAAELAAAMAQHQDPVDRLADMARRYVRIAVDHRALFAVLYEAGLDKTRYPEIEAAAEPVDEGLMACVNELADGAVDAEELVTALEATARGYVALFLEDEPAAGPDKIARAAEQAARVTRALIAGRQLLGSGSS